MTTAQMLRAEGEALGEARGERHTIRMVAQARGLALTDRHSALIDRCDDLATRQKWSNVARSRPASRPAHRP